MKVFLNCCKPTMFKGSETQAQPIEAKKPEVKSSEAQSKLKAQPQKDTVEISAPKTEAKPAAKADAKQEAKPVAKPEVKTEAKPAVK